jgi:hypothetical protein
MPRSCAEREKNHGLRLIDANNQIALRATFHALRKTANPSRAADHRCAALIACFRTGSAMNTRSAWRDE